jgi:hypothetical protein
MAPSDWIASGAFDRIRDETRRVVELLETIDGRTVGA